MAKAKFQTEKKHIDSDMNKALKVWFRDMSFVSQSRRNPTGKGAGKAKRSLVGLK